MDSSFNVTLQSIATAAQIALAKSTAATYVDVPRTIRPIAAIVADLQNLTTPQQQKLLFVTVAYMLQQNPTAGTALGIPIVGDQPG